MSAHNHFSFTGKVWRWPGVGGWHFVNLDKELSAKVRKVGKPYGSGFIKVKVKVGKSTWITALFPQRQTKSYMVSIKKSIRQEEGVWDGSILKISFTLI